MAISAVGPYWLGFQKDSTDSFAVGTIDASGEKTAFIFRVPKTGNIDRLTFRVAAVTSSQTLRIGLQTLDSSGDPSGSAYGGSVYTTQASPASSTTYEVTLATPASATIGDWCAMVIEFDSTAGNLTIGLGNVTGVLGSNYTDNYTTSWAKITREGLFSIRYDDGTYHFCGQTIPASNATTSFNSSSTPDEYALKIVTAVQLQTNGIAAYVDMDNAADIILYDSGGTALETGTLSTVNRQNTARNWTLHPFANRTLAAGTYYIALKPTTTSNIAVVTMAYLSASQIVPISDQATLSLATRTDAGSWSETTTSLIMAALRVNGIETGSGSGSGVPGNLLGGMFQ